MHVINQKEFHIASSKHTKSVHIFAILNFLFRNESYDVVNNLFVSERKHEPTLY